MFNSLVGFRFFPNMNTLLIGRLMPITLKFKQNVRSKLRYTGKILQKSCNGASQTHLVICDEEGKLVVSKTGPGTNHWMIGIPECARRIADMVKDAKKEAGMPEENRLASLGLGLSGCEQEATNKELENEIKKSYPNVAESFVVCSDTLISVFTSSKIGGLVLISGTGSNALLRNPDGTIYTCGGWGHLLGDEGSACHISLRAIKIVFDHEDNLKKSSYPIGRTWELIKQHFEIETRLDLLTHCYANFDKSFLASLCKKLAAAASESDQLCVFLFKEAGEHIARSIHALIPKVHNDLIISGDLNIVCVGSVWRSWDLLKDGFLTEISTKTIPFNLHLVRIIKSMAYGAAYLGADAIKYNLPRNYSDNIEALFHYNPKEYEN